MDAQAPPQIVLETRFRAPLATVHAFLTDFREDDQAKYFGGKAGARVRREGSVIHLETLETPTPLGLNVARVEVHSPARWTAESEFRKGGKVALRHHIVETLRAHGDITTHRVEIRQEPLTAGMRLMLVLVRPMMRSSLRKGFDKMVPDVEAEARSGHA
jgi:hypothetical protein